MISRFALAFAVVALAVTPALAHEPFGWREVTPPGPNPPARSSHAIAFDGARGRAVLFGGQTESGALLGDTWEWDGAAWTDVTPALPSPSPSPRRSHAMAYDATVGRVVLFGGLAADGRAADTWLWDGAAWESVAPSEPGPEARRGHALVTDPVRRVVVLAAGSGDAGLLTDTWEWTGEARAWALACDACVGVENPGFYYDNTLDQVALVAGRLADGTLSEDTRLWDGAAWEICTKLLPRREGSIGAYDRARGFAVVFGGASPEDTLTSRFSCGMFEPIEEDGCPLPPARTGHVIAYDARRGETVLFGGLDGTIALGDTWVLGRDACAVRAGHVGTGDGSPPVDVVTVNGETGDECREVEVTAGEPVEIHVATAPSRAASGRGQFALWILDGEPLPCDIVPLSFRSYDGQVHELGLSTRPLPIANTMIPSAGIACSLAFPIGAISRPLGAGWANLICVNPRPGFGRSPVTLRVTFPEGKYTIGAVVHDENSILSPVKPASIANWIVVHAE